MSTSGSRDEWVTKYDTLRFNWWQTGQSISDNCTYIGWNLQLISGAYGAISSSASKTWSVNINGTSYSGTNTVSIGNNATKTLAEGYSTIYHNNDGTKWFAYSFSQEFNINFNGSRIGTISGSSSGTLDTIPRYASIIEAPDFNDEETNLTINFSNPGNFDIKLKMEAGGDQSLIVRDRVTKYGPYTFVLTEEEKKKLRQKCVKNELSVRFVVCTYLNGIESQWSWLDRTMTLINYTPTLNPTVIDVGPTSTTLTGDPNKLIMHYNIARVTFNAVAVKEATISDMRVTCGNASRTSDGDMGYIENGTFIFTVTDSRGNSATKTITKEIIDYIPLTCNMITNTDLIDGNTANINLSIKGKYFDGSFGVANNTLSIEYRYKINNDAYPVDENGNEVWTNLTGSISNNEYTAQTTIEGLDYTNSYTFQARAKDLPYSGGITTPEKVVKIVPVFDWGENDFNFNVSVHSTGGFTYDIPVNSYDFNAITKSGRYYAGDDSTNRPINKNGWLDVQIYGDGNYCYQKYITNSGEKYERWKNDGAWGQWIETNKGQHVLWSGVLHMTQNQSISLSENISAQKTGIQVIFSAYDNSSQTVHNWDFREFNILKSFLQLGRIHSFTLHSPTFANMGAKELTIDDSIIYGSQFNTRSGTSESGIVYDNSNWVLRYVIGF